MQVWTFDVKVFVLFARDERRGNKFSDHYNDMSGYDRYGGDRFGNRNWSDDRGCGYNINQERNYSYDIRTNDGNIDFPLCF